MNRWGHIVFLTVVCAYFSATSVEVLAQSIKPDSMLSGASMSGWKSEGQAQWRMENGEIVGKPTGPNGGWLVSEKSLQDVGVLGNVRCATGCKAGILLRKERLPNGGTKALLVSLAPDDLASYRIEFDASGKELSRVALAGNAGMNRVLVPPPPVAEGAGRGAASGGGAGRGGGRAANPPNFPIKPRDTRFRPDDWNSVEIFVDANVLAAQVNDGTAIQGGATDTDGSGFGPVALYVYGNSEVRFKGVGYQDLAVKVQPINRTSPNFREQRVEDFMYSWGVTVADINRDGNPDILAGPNYYLGPDFTKKQEFTLSKTFSPSADSPVFQVELAADFTGDGWIDILDVSLNRPAKLYVNPKGQSRRWDMHEVFPRVGGELAMLVDIYKDGKKQVLLNIGGALALVSPDAADPTKPWIVNKITDIAPQHGMGVGDINGDGRVDVTLAYGWWEQPVRGTPGTWTYHPVAFSPSGRGAAEMGIYDINGDGLNDVITALEAHDSGISWFEQKRGANGEISFVEHKIMGGLFDADNVGGVAFTQIHGSIAADLNGDRIPDFIAGRRFWSHHESLSDPDSNSPAYLYVYKTVRDKAAPGGARFEPELINNRSGAGSQVVATDLNKDGAVDVVTTGAKGTFVFWGRTASQN